MFSDIINSEINSLPLEYQKEVLDFVRFLKNKVKEESSSDNYLDNPEFIKAVKDGLNTPLENCSKELNW